MVSAGCVEVEEEVFKDFGGVAPSLYLEVFDKGEPWLTMTSTSSCRTLSGVRNLSSRACLLSVTSPPSEDRDPTQPQGGG